MSASTLVVVTHRRWLAEDFAAAAATRGVRVVHSLGLDVPVLADDPRDVAWWAPTEWAARALAAGADLALTSPGPYWADHLSYDLLGRRVESSPLALAGRHPAFSAPGWWKPAEFKADRVPCAYRTAEEFRDACAAAGIPDEAVVQWSEPLPPIVEEHRVFVLDRQPVASSPYLIDGVVWHEQMRSDHDADALAFATEVCTTRSQSFQPHAYVLDVALVEPRPGQRRWVVLEENPAWSSAPYGADMTEVLAVVLAANERRPEAGDHRQWRPDPYLAQRAARQRLLPLSRPVSRQA